MEGKEEFSIKRERFDLLVKRARKKALLRNIVSSLSTSLLLHWLVHRKLFDLQNSKKKGLK